MWWIGNKASAFVGLCLFVFEMAVASPMVWAAGYGPSEWQPLAVGVLACDRRTHKLAHADTLGDLQALVSESLALHPPRQGSFPKWTASNSLRTKLWTLPVARAEALYAEVLSLLQRRHPWPPSVEKYFRAGVEGLIAAFQDEDFIKAAGLQHGESEQMAQTLRWLYEQSYLRPDDAHDAVIQAARLAREVHSRVGLSASIALIEQTRAACASLDDGTALLAPASFMELKQLLTPENTGVGIGIGLQQGATTVVSVRPGSSADSAGVHAGDILLAVDGVQTKHLDVPEVRALLLGPPGTRVDILIRRGEELHHFELIREPYKEPTVTDSITIGMNKRVLYLRVTRFLPHTPQELAKALGQMPLSTEAIVLDLRGCPGGAVRAAVECADLFLDAGPIVYVRTTDQRQWQQYEAAPGQVTSVLLIVLVDRSTGSAAELFAGSLQHRRRAYLLGTATHGKNKVQQVFPLHAAPTGLRLVVGEYAFEPHANTPVPLQPDWVVSEEMTKPTLRHGIEDDPWIKAALEMIRTMQGATDGSALP